MGELVVTVIPGPVWPRATLFEHVPKTLTAGTVHDITVVPRDRHGNTGATEAVVRVDLREAGADKERSCQVRRVTRSGTRCQPSTEYALSTAGGGYSPPEADAPSTAGGGYSPREAYALS
eukprot:270356-Prorocentrum_minimum.AAC.2